MFVKVQKRMRLAKMDFKEMIQIMHPSEVLQLNGMRSREVCLLGQIREDPQMEMCHQRVDAEIWEMVHIQLSHRQNHIELNYPWLEATFRVEAGATPQYLSPINRLRVH